MMKKSSIIVLQFVIIVLGIIVFGFMILEPQFEGRNVGATLSQVYLHDPFLIYAYLTSTAFFTALYQTFKLLSLIGDNKLFTISSIKILRTIRRCAVVILISVLGALGYLIVVRPEEDIAGGVFMGILIIAGSGIVATLASVFEQIVIKGLSLKSQ